jgi:hypothetical protein
MALTEAFYLTAGEVISSALRKLGVVAQGESADASQVTEGLEALKAILKELNAFSTCRWKTYDATLNLVAGTSYYASGTVPVSFANDCHRLISMQFLPALTGTTALSTPVEIVDPIRWFAIRDITTAGNPTMCYVHENYLLPYKGISVYPTPIAVTPGYLRYFYEKTIQVINVTTDYLDVPMEWQRYIVLRLASDLSHEYGINVNEIGLLEQKCDKALSALNFDQFYQYEKVKIARSQGSK